jgi:hypothetical protein
VQARTGVTFAQIAREARAVMGDHGGDLLAVVDATGLGQGVAEQVRRAGVPTVAVTLTAGSKITGGRWRMNLPVGVMFSTLYSVLAQGRLRLGAGVSDRLAEELKSVERAVSEAGRESYVVPRGEGHHGDTVYALGLAVVAGERLGGRERRGLVLARERRDKTRRPGTRTPLDTARRVLEELRREREEAWERVAGPLWRPLRVINKP